MHYELPHPKACYIGPTTIQEQYARQKMLIQRWAAREDAERKEHSQINKTLFEQISQQKNRN